MVEFLVQMPNLELRFQVHLIVVLRSQTVARLGTVLTHHDNRRLHRRETGQNQIEQNEWIRIERSGGEQSDVRINSAIIPLSGDFVFLQIWQTSVAVTVLLIAISPLN